MGQGSIPTYISALHQSGGAYQLTVMNFLHTHTHPPTVSVHTHTHTHTHTSSVITDVAEQGSNAESD